MRWRSACVRRLSKCLDDWITTSCIQHHPTMLRLMILLQWFIQLIKSSLLSGCTNDLTSWLNPDYLMVVQTNCLSILLPHCHEGIALLESSWLCRWRLSPVDDLWALNFSNFAPDARLSRSFEHGILGWCSLFWCLFHLPPCGLLLSNHGVMSL